MIRDQTLALMLVAMARSVGGKPLSVHHTAATEACQTTSRTCHPCNTNGCEVLKKAEASSAGDCCDQCTKTAGCASWTYNTKPGQVPCHLKTAATPAAHGDGCISGQNPSPSPPPSPPAPNPNKKNILFLMCDSMDGRVLDPTSAVSARIDMPNLRKLAAGGTNFVNTYCAAPQCVPSRTTMFTGRHTHQIRAWSNENGVAGIPSVEGTGLKGLDPECLNDYGEDLCAKMKQAQNVSATLLDTMRAAAYEPHLYGKVDVGAGIVSDWDQGNATVPGFHGGATMNIMTRSADIRKPTKPDPLSITNDKDNNVHPEDWKMIPKCVEFLRNFAGTGKTPGQQQPGPSPGTPYENWMLYCSINIPHPAFNTNATWLGYVNDDKVDIPVWLPEGQFHPADSYMSQSKHVWASNYSDADILKVRKTYYAMCAETDFLLGRVLDALHDSGQYDNTYIVFVSDHGEMNMEHRQVWKNSMYEASSRVPMIIAGPGLKQGSVVKNLTSLLDVYPTLVAMTGATPPDFLEGHSLFPLMAAGTTAAPVGQSDYPQDRFVVSQYHSNMGNTGSFMIRWRRFKYITYGHALPKIFNNTGYIPQLFDVEADPEELTDLAANAASVATMRLMDSMLRQEIADPEAVDAECKEFQQALFERIVMPKVNAGKQTLLQACAKGYKGCDTTDVAKIEAWRNPNATLF